jgi:hypothetical protein
MSKFDYTELQNKLNKSKELIKNLDQKFDNYERKIQINKLESEYKELCSQFSPAYLSGCSWYVGDSILNASNNKSIENLFFMIGCTMK